MEFYCVQMKAAADGRVKVTLKSGRQAAAAEAEEDCKRVRLFKFLGKKA